MDIRRIGDGDMGMVNTNAQFGWNVGFGTGVLLMGLRGHRLLLVGVVMMILIIPAKVPLDQPRRVQLRTRRY